jgi:poly[(R)-3-hydroxyalkanoate] polymerase subunit PhaC
MSQNKTTQSDNLSALKRYRTGMQIMLEGAKADTGQTLKEVIWTKNKAKLYHYEPKVEKRFSVPILIIYGLINRPYVLDLMPGNSFVEYLVEHGFDVFMLDWGTPGDEDKKLSFEDYVLDYIPRAVKKALRATRAEEISLLGYCMGGTIAAMYAALFPDQSLRNLVLLTAPIDFTPADMGMFRLITSPKYFDPDHIVEAFGNVPGDLIDTGNRMLKPVTNFVGTYVTMWDRIMQGKSMDTWLAMNKWVNDGVPFVGEAFRQWIRDFYQQNKLVKGEIILRGRRVDLSNMRCHILSVAGSKDHICSLPQAQAIERFVSGKEVEFHVVDAGHVGLMTGSHAKKDVWPKIFHWLELRSK